MIIKIIVVLAVLIGVGYAQNEKFEINSLKVHFDESTPQWGPFSVSADVVIPESYRRAVVVYCMYVTDGGYKANTVSILQKGVLIEDENRKTITEIKFEGFRGEHPEIPGEVVVSILGQEVVRSLKVQTNFHPNSDD